jgi:hypothetical protein
LIYISFEVVVHCLYAEVSRMNYVIIYNLPVAYGPMDLLSYVEVGLLDDVGIDQLYPLSIGTMDP